MSFLVSTIILEEPFSFGWKRSWVVYRGFIGRTGYGRLEIEQAIVPLLLPAGGNLDRLNQRPVEHMHALLR